MKFAIEQYIKYCNEYGMKEKWGWMSPVQYRRKLLVVQK
ncbi:IS3 family transposase [Clostridium sp.]|uniref:IS3 family transposase n=1 Tax=Clostridium porci TaxID=2605778 RepID=A0A7X2NLK6_9CLOT|nr:IS3 family transposase [Clostridium porci]HBF3623759.1 IS3 family transposase [Clostridioides difficile]